MRRLLFSAAVASFAAMSWSASADEPAVRAAIKQYVEAFNAHDMAKVAASWSENAVHVDQDLNETTEGRDAIVSDIAAAMERLPQAKLVGEVENVRMVTPDVAAVTGSSAIENPGEEPAVSLFAATFVQKEGAWLIDSITEHAAPVPTSATALRELEWLVGSWVDESEDARIVTSFRWTDDGAFLLRSFDAQVGDQIARRGTQVIGWDPRAEHIRSWTFDSDGSFGEAVWSQNDGEWIIRSNQTLSDGRAASGTFVLARIDDETATLRLIGHEIEGEPQASGEAVTMRRVHADDASIDATSAELPAVGQGPEDAPAPAHEAAPTPIPPVAPAPTVIPARAVPGLPPAPAPVPAPRAGRPQR